MNFYLANGAKLSEVLILLHKMETQIWNKTRIWNTFADDQLIFHIRVYTVLTFLSLCSKLISTKGRGENPVNIIHE